MTVTICGFDELPSWVEKNSLSNNGSGMEYANYLLIEHLGRRVVYSDAMESEDCKFYRDLRWIREAILTAYEEGMASK